MKGRRTRVGVVSIAAAHIKTQSKEKKRAETSGADVEEESRGWSWYAND